MPAIASEVGQLLTTDFCSDESWQYYDWDSKTHHCHIYAWHNRQTDRQAQRYEDRKPDRHPSAVA
eukprot:scaffold230851_cov19-Prasinocladus_malaysianus.AAC.1